MTPSITSQGWSNEVVSDVTARTTKNNSQQQIEKAGILHVLAICLKYVKIVYIVQIKCPTFNAGPAGCHTVLLRQ